MPRLVLCLACVLALTSTACADYIISPELQNGSTSVSLAPGDPFDLYIRLTSDDSGQHNSVIFQVVFEEWSTGLPAPGLSYETYDWRASYQNRSEGSLDDDSHLLDTDLPAILAEDTLSGAGYPANTVDVELSNVLDTGAFGVGDLVVLTLKVPYGYTGSDTVRISVVPDTIAEGFSEITTTAGDDFMLTVVPEPGTMVLLGLSCLLLARRRRS